MAYRTFTLDDGLKFIAYKRRGLKSIRLSVASGNKIRVFMPYFVPYSQAISFVKKNRQWLAKQTEKTSIIDDNQQIGKAHRMKFLAVETNEITGKILKNFVEVKYPFGLEADSEEVQAVAKKYAIEALRREAKNLLPIRLQFLAERYNFSYSSVKVKNLRSRWGSCDNEKLITLNLYLMQLPWHLIDYVLLHELTHTEHMNHGTDFWEKFESVLPEAKILRKETRTYKPEVMGF